MSPILAVAASSFKEACAVSLRYSGDETVANTSPLDVTEKGEPVLALFKYFSMLALNSLIFTCSIIFISCTYILYNIAYLQTLRF